MDIKVFFFVTSIVLIGSVYVLWNMIEDEGEDEDEEKTVPPNNKSVPMFIPTNEWQEVLPNQPVPPGLSIRFDFETGKNYAKLPDHESKADSVIQMKDHSFTQLI